MGYKLYSNITYLNPTESDRKILEKVFITRKCTQRKTLHNLKTDIFDLSDNTNITKLFSIYQKQPPRGVHRKRCSRNMQKIYRRTPMPIPITSAWCSPVNLMHIFRIPFPKNTSEWLLLKLWTFFPGSSQLQFWYISNIDTTIPFPRASLHPSPSLSNFPLVNLNPSSTQSSLCSSSVSLFFSYPIRPRQKYWIYQTISRAKLYKSWYVMGQNATY